MKNSTRTGEPEGVAVHTTEEPLNIAPLAIFVEIVLPEGGGDVAGVVPQSLVSVSGVAGIVEGVYAITVGGGIRQVIIDVRRYIWPNGCDE